MADDKNGFNAVVKYDQHFVHPIPMKQEVTSHNHVHLNPAQETVPDSDVYKNADEIESIPQSHIEVQTVIQHEGKYPKTFSDFNGDSLEENYQDQHETISHNNINTHADLGSSVDFSPTQEDVNTKYGDSVSESVAGSDSSHQDQHETVFHNNVQTNSQPILSFYNLYGNLADVSKNIPVSNTVTLNTKNTDYSKSKDPTIVSDSNKKHLETTYIYIPKEIDVSDDSIKSSLQSEAASQNEEKDIQKYYSYSSDHDVSLSNEKGKTQEFTKTNELQTVGSEENINSVNDQQTIIVHPVEIDLVNVLKQNTLEESELQVTSSESPIKYSSKDNSVKPSHQFTQEEVKKLLEGYNKLSEPVYETGFIPITKKPNHLITQPMIPNTYRSNLKVNSTPGLKYYSSRGNSKFKRNKYDGFNNSQQKHVPIFNHARELRKENPRVEYTRLYRSAPIKSPFVRYAKHIRFLD